MEDIEFNCSDCIFASIKSGEQIGCTLNRIEKFSKYGVTRNNGRYQFNRYCNAYRPPEYLGDKSINMDNFLNEIRPRITYIIDFDYDLTLLQSNIESINGNVGAIIIINDKVEYNEDIALYLSKTGYKYYIVQMLLNLSEQDKFDNAFKHAKNGWAIFLTKGDKLPNNYYDIIDTKINIDMTRLAFSKNEKGSFIIQSALYSFIKRNEELKGDTLEEKIGQVKKSDPDILPQWGDLFNA